MREVLSQYQSWLLADRNERASEASGRHGVVDHEMRELAVRHLLRHHWRHVVEVRVVGVVFGQRRGVGDGGFGEVRVLRRVRRGARGLGMQGFHGSSEGNLGLDEKVGLRNLVRHPGSGHGSLGEARALQDQLAQFRDGDPLGGVALKYAAQDTDHLRGQGQDGLEKERILQVSPECGILKGGTLPWVPTAGQVDQHHTQAPHVIGRRGVVGHGAGVCLLTFCAGTIRGMCLGA